MVKEFIKKGHEIILVAPHDKYVNFLEQEGVRFKSININKMGLNPIQDIKLTWQYCRLMRKIQPDVLLTFTIKPTIYGNIASRFTKTKTISNITGLGTIFIKPSFATKLAMVLYRFALGKCGKVFFQNPTDYRFFKLKGLVSATQSAVIPGSGIDVVRFQHPKRSFSEGKLKFLFVGRIIKDKGIVEFLEAAKIVGEKFPDSRFHVVGKMGYENRTALSKDEFREYLKNERISYLAYTDNMGDVYKTNDIMVLPSYREGMSRALLEAAAMKMPIITTNVPGCREIVKDSVNGYLVKSKSIEDLVKAMKKILSLKEEELIKMANNSRNLIENNFSDKLVLQMYLDAIEDILPIRL